MRDVNVLMQDRDWTLIVEALRHHGRNHPGEHAQYLRGLAVVIEEADAYDREVGLVLEASAPRDPQPWRADRWSHPGGES